LSVSRGRPRDRTIDGRVLAAARDHLAGFGYEALSISAVAAAAGTTRQAVYRRWPSKADLATAAIAALSEAGEREPTEDPFADLVTELEAFREGISRPDGVSMVGTMLLRSTDPELRELFRERIVRPRRARLREILVRGQRAGILDENGDVELAVAMLTGSWYAGALSGDPAPPDWARRAATVVWRGLGGRVSSRRPVRSDTDPT
jgi:AcrR family transcriptional regulator